MDEISTGFSLVLCTFNGETRLEPTLTHIASLKTPKNIPVEFILVDNASTDDTTSFSKKLWTELKQPFPLNVIHELKPGKGYAIETGYDAAQYSYIVTVDDDNWLSEDYLINAFELIQQHPDVGIFQAGNQPVFEAEPPNWTEGLEGYMVIGSPVQKEGYFNKNYYGVWGAGMITMNTDWKKLRKSGFSTLTGKIPGKAAGEDVELAIALLLKGKKIFYSDTLFYKHYMPAKRISWDMLEENFKTFAYTQYYFFLYSKIFEGYEKRYSISLFRFKISFIKYWLKLIKSRGLKGNLQYLFAKKKNVNRLLLRQYYSLIAWFFKLSGKAVDDMRFIQSWMLPLLKSNPNNFRM